MAKESRQVSEFTDFGGLLHFFKSKMIFEKEDFDLLRDYCDSDVDDDDILEEKKQSVPFDKGPVLKNLNQVRNSGVSPSNPNIIIIVYINFIYFGVASF